MPKLPFTPRPYAIEVPGDGAPDAQIAVIGEAPGFEEVKDRTPFVGVTGKMFWQLALKYARIDRGMCYVDNLCQRRLDDDAKVKLDVEEFGFWRERLYARLRSLGPRLVVAVGALSSRALLGEGFALHVGHGLPHLWEGITIVPVYHPAAALRGDSNSLALTAYDLDQAGKWWRGELPEARDDGPEETANQYRIVYGSPMAIDTEYVSETGEPICLTATAETGRAFVI